MSEATIENCTHNCSTCGSNCSGRRDPADLIATPHEGSIIKNEEKRVLHRAIRKLKPEYEQALYLTYFEDFSNRETASIMKKTEKQVRDILFGAALHCLIDVVIFL